MKKLLGLALVIAVVFIAPIKSGRNNNDTSLIVIHENKKQNIISISISIVLDKSCVEHQNLSDLVKFPVRYEQTIEEETVMGPVPHYNFPGQVYFLLKTICSSIFGEKTEDEDEENFVKNGGFYNQKTFMDDLLGCAENNNEEELRETIEKES